jgi:2'-5' RNA ligase
MAPFEIELNGFGSFPNPNNPVIFVHPESNPNLTELYHRVKDRFDFIKYSFSPHMTVGYRDLTWENYLRAWEVYKDKEYKTKFLVDKISLLRFDNQWISIAENELRTL